MNLFECSLRRASLFLSLFESRAFSFNFSNELAINLVAAAHGAALVFYNKFQLRSD